MLLIVINFIDQSIRRRSYSSSTALSALRPMSWLFLLQINGMTTENLSLLETKHLVEKSRGRLTMTVLRDSRKFLVSIPEVVDSAPNSEDDRRHDSSSELEGGSPR